MSPRLLGREVVCRVQHRGVQILGESEVEEMMEMMEVLCFFGLRRCEAGGVGCQHCGCQPMTTVLGGSTRARSW